MSTEGLKDIPLSRELLEFYRRKVDDFDKEREDYITRLQSLQISREVEHRLQWEVKKREEEIEELKKALTEARMQIFEQRKSALELYSTNEELKAQRFEDSKKIQHLLAMMDAKRPEITYFRRRDPEATGGLRQSFGTRTQTDMRNEALDYLNSPGGPQTPASKSQAQALVRQVSSLKRQMDELKRIHRDELDAVLDQRRIAEQEYKMKLAQTSDQLTQAQQRLTDLDTKLQASIRDYLVLRHNSQVANRAMKEDLEQTKEQLQAATEMATACKEHAEDKIKRVEQQAKRKSDDHVEAFRKQVKNREVELRKLQGDYEEAKAKYEKRVADLETKAKDVGAKYSKLSKRRGLEVEGFTSDISALRKQLKGLEAIIASDTNGAFDSELQVLQQAVRNSQDGVAVSKDLRGLKVRLQGIEKELYGLPFTGSPWE